MATGPRHVSCVGMTWSTIAAAASVPSTSATSVLRCVVCRECVFYLWTKCVAEVESELHISVLCICLVWRVCVCVYVCMCVCVQIVVCVYVCVVVCVYVCVHTNWPVRHHWI